MILRKTFSSKKGRCHHKIKEGPFSRMLKECIEFHLWSPHDVQMTQIVHFGQYIDTLEDVTFKEETESSVRKVLKTASQSAFVREGLSAQNEMKG